MNAKEAAAFIISQTKGIDFYEDIREQIKNDKSSLAGMFLGYKTGPVGDALYLNSVYEVTGDKSYFDQAIKNIDILVDAAVKDEKGICCGEAGVLEYFCQIYKLTGDERYLNAAHTTASTLLSEAITNANKTKWVGAWERVSPAKQGNYTGFYVGVSGVASALLQTYATDKNIQLVDFFEFYNV